MGNGQFGRDQDGTGQRCACIWWGRALRRPGHRMERVFAGEALQLRFPAFAERNTAGMFGDLADRRRHDDLTAARLARNTGGEDHGLAEEPLRLLDRFAGVQANAHPNRLVGMDGAVFGERLLDRDRAAEPIESVREGEEEAVTLQFELDTAVHAELLADDRVVGLDHAVRCAVAQPFGHLGEPFHVAEHEGDVAIGSGEVTKIGAAALDAGGDGFDGRADVDYLKALDAELVLQHALHPARAPALLPVTLDRDVELLDLARGLVRGEERAAPDVEYAGLVPERAAA